MPKLLDPNSAVYKVLVVTDNLIYKNQASFSRAQRLLSVSTRVLKLERGCQRKAEIAPGS